MVNGAIPETEKQDEFLACEFLSVGAIGERVRGAGSTDEELDAPEREPKFNPEPR